MDDIIAIICWVGLLGAVAAILLSKFRGKKKYEGVKFNNDSNWLEKSLAKYSQNSEKRRYFFHTDKNVLNTGYILEDDKHNTVYEIKVLYNNGLEADEADFENHIIKYTHHHQIGKLVSIDFFSGDHGIALSSTFKFDNEDIFAYLEDKGYDYHFNIEGLSYSIDILNRGQKVAKLYSTTNGKNLYEAGNDEIKSQPGSGFFIVEADYSNLDIALLYAMTFAKVEFNLGMLKNL